jgi:hypothetical protein
MPQESGGGMVGGSVGARRQELAAAMLLAPSSLAPIFLLYQTLG